MAAFLFDPRPTGAVHAAAQNMSLSVLLYLQKGRRSTDFHACRPVPGACCTQLIYQFTSPHPSLLSCCSSTMYATFPCSETECLQNYCKIRRSLYDASKFSMQNGKIYMLHSFSSQVYSFQRRRQFLRENKSNICTFFVWISAICVFLFACCFVIIIVYNGGCAESPFKTMFSVF